MYFSEAQKKTPDSPTLLLAPGRANHELENYGVAKKVHDRLRAADPTLAARYAYLSDSSIPISFSISNCIFSDTFTARNSTTIA